MDINNSSEPQGNLYAVYGSLRKGLGNHRLFENDFSEYLGTMKTEPKFKMVSLGGFPGVIPDAGTQEIVVEIYRVTNPRVDQNLDALEGYPRFYQKTTIPTQWGTASMYILSEEQYGQRSIVASGDWKEHISKIKY